MAVEAKQELGLCPDQHRDESIRFPRGNRAESVRRISLARDANALLATQQKFANLMKQLAIRGSCEGSLARIPEASIAKKLQAWVKALPTDFYQELFRLRSLDFSTDTMKRPQYFGVFTHDIV